MYCRVVKIGGSYSSALACLDKGLVIDKGNNAYMAKLFYTRALLNTRYRMVCSIWSYFVIRYERLESAVGDCTSALEYDPRHYKVYKSSLVYLLLSNLRFTLFVLVFYLFWQI